MRQAGVSVTMYEAYVRGYTLGPVISTGKGGVVQFAKSAEETECVIKTREACNDSEKVSVETERKILESLPHPNIVKLVEYIAADGKATQHIFILEKLQMDLFSYLTPPEGNRPLAETQARLVFRGVASAVEHLHAHSIAHMDIKPENILLSMLKGSIISAKLCDFGLSETGMALKGGGTLDYQSPESLRLSVNYYFELPDARIYCAACSDVYSLGASLYTALLARHPHDDLGELYEALEAPFHHRGRQDLRDAWLNALTRRQIPPVFSHEDNVSKEAQQLIISMLCGPDDRATLAEVAASEFFRENAATGAR